MPAGTIAPSRRRRSTGATVLTSLMVCAVLAATVAAMLTIVQREARSTGRAQWAAAALAEGALAHVTSGAVARLTDLATAMRTADGPGDDVFAALARPVLDDEALHAVAVLQRVPERRRWRFEATHGGGIRELRPSGALVPAPRRRIHLPVDLVANGDAGILQGTDPVAAFPSLRRALDAARRERRPVASPPLKSPRGLGTTVVLFVPASADVDRVAAGLVRPEAVAAAIRAALPASARFSVRDGAARLGGDRGTLRDPVFRRVGVAGRTWTVAIARPRPSMVRTAGVGFVGLLLALVVGLLGRRAALRQRAAESARDAVKARSRRLAASATDILCVHDRTGRLTYVSPAAREVLGREPETLLGRLPRDLLHPDDNAAIGAVLHQAAAGADRLEVTHRLRKAGGDYVWVETRVRVLRDADGRVVEWHSGVRDITDRVATQQALEEAEERFRTAFDEAPIGMAITSLDGRYAQVNRAFARLLGRSRAELEGRPVSALTHPDDRAADAAAIATLIAGEASSQRVEKRFVHADGRPVWVSRSVTLVRDASGQPLHFLAQLQDITERRRYEAELRQLADHDPLTGLLNRRSFERELELHVAGVADGGACGAAMVLDLDHFKTINDTLGHGAGDELIARVARGLRERLRDGDVLARLGGDEFAILLRSGGRAEAEAVARDVLEIVRAQAVTAATGRPRRSTASIGIALFGEREAVSGEAALVAADLAMYEAKEAGRDRYAVADADGHAEPLGNRISWADVIRDALAEDRFVLHAQPIVDLGTERTSQYELLLRMVASDGDLIMPGAFLPVAERFDLIREIDRWVVRRAIAMLAEAAVDGHEITVEVNLSGRSAGEEELLALIEADLQATGVDPGRLILEVTETEAVEDIARAQGFAGRLAELGCRFALDDFGAGFGSFFYLKHLPFDYLKIDGEFVRQCAHDPGDQLIIEALVHVARGMGKRTVAEQVGDAETVALLRALGVDQAQGYHLGRPAPLADWLRVAPRTAPRPAARLD